ncbi:hypothetical protein E2C01_019434 [Portunus trituberculatus]|uniref:Uncharacterized protein n=1 Tax=Portunus trituberculatus TaxID=210409 RepID=A0A5B7DXW3_PORTR|nr:hypothetical protein [Portunus trituberculatus]
MPFSLLLHSLFFYAPRLCKVEQLAIRHFLPLPIARYLVEVAWLSRQVNPLCEAIAPPPVLAKPLETKLMADLAHLLTFCSTDPAASIPDLENYPNMRRQLEGLGLPLEKLWQAHIIALSAPHDPLLGTLERYVERYTSSSSSSTTRHRHQQESSTRLLRDGTSATVLSHTLFVPVPAYRMWQGLDITKDKWKQVWSGLPRSYRCVVEVLVALCGMTCRELLEEVQAMEKMVEIYSSLLFLFPNAL